MSHRFSTILQIFTVCAGGATLSAQSLAQAAPFGNAACEVTKPQEPIQDCAQRHVLVKLAGSGHEMWAGDTANLAGIREVSPLGVSSLEGPHATRSEWCIAQLADGVSVEQALGMLAKDPSVVSVEPDFRISVPTQPGTGNVETNSVDDPSLADQWALERIEAFGAWNIHAGSPSVVVAVIDTGVQTDHPDLADHIWRNSDEVVNGVDDDGNGYIDDTLGWDFGDNDRNPNDSDGHGTHVSGIIAAIQDNNLGISGTAQITIMPLRIFDANGDAHVSSIVNAILYAKRNGADIINMSFGSYTPSEAIGDACLDARSNGVVLLASAGNENTTERAYPAALPWVLSVGATDRNDERASFSNYGMTVFINAPGEHILSTLPNSSYGYMSGTSMACPYAAAVVALIKSSEPNLEAIDVETRLRQTADNKGTGRGVGSRGRVNARRALGGPEDDDYEQNDDSGEAATLSAGTYNLQGWDQDWFRLSLNTAKECTVTISGPEGDLDLYILDASENILVSSGAEDSEESASARLEAGTFFVRVDPYEHQGSSYELVLTLEDPPQDDEYEQNDSRGQAKSIAFSSYSLEGLDDDWFRIGARRGEVSVTIEGPDGDLDLYLHSATGLLAESTTSNSSEAIRADLAGGQYLIHVEPYEGRTSSYTLSVEFTPASNPQPRPDLDVGCVSGLCGVCTMTTMLATVLGMLGVGTRLRPRQPTVR